MLTCLTVQSFFEKLILVASEADMVNVCLYSATFLAHLSRRLSGELIVYRSSRRPSVRASVCPHFQT